MPSSIMNAVRQLTEIGVGRLEHFEALLVLALHPDSGWDCERVRANSSLDLKAAGEALAHLHRQGLLDLVKPEPPCYRLGSRVDRDQLGRLRRDYERDRSRVVDAFFTCNLDSLRSFASAFRVRRP